MKYLNFGISNSGKNLFYHNIQSNNIDWRKSNGINPTRQGEQAIKVVVERIDEIQATLDKSATKNINRK